MPITDPLGRIVPDATPGALEAANPQAWFERYSLSDTGIVPVTSRTAANAVLAARNTAASQPGMGVARKPVVVWRSDTPGGSLELHPNTGSSGEGWVVLSGGMHGAQIQFSRPSMTQGSDPKVLYPSGITRATPGWTIDGNNFTIPRTGVYALTAIVNIDAPAASLGRVLGQFTTTSGSVHGRPATGTNENNYVIQLAAWPFSAGDLVRIQCYHETGGTVGYTGSLVIVQQSEPAW